MRILSFSGGGQRAFGAIVCLSALLAVACGGPTSPAANTPTGYLMTVRAAASCGTTLGEPLRAVVKYQGESSDWHVFLGLRTIGSPRDPTLEVRLRNAAGGTVEGTIYAGFLPFAGSPGLYFRMPDSPGFPVRIPFGGAGDVLKSDISATLNAYIWNAFGSCSAANHRLEFVRVFDRFE